MPIHYIEQNMGPCPVCRRQTVFARSNHRANWPLHIVIALVTFGIWLPIALLFRMFTGYTAGPWTCTTCGWMPLPKRIQKPSNPARSFALVFGTAAVLACVLIYLEREAATRQAGARANPGIVNGGQPK